MAKSKGTTFVARSPWTGAEFTRTSHHAYTHAVILHSTAAAERLRVERDLAGYERQLAECLETAAHLRDGTTPAAGSPLLARCGAHSWNTQQAGVNTKWDMALYDVAGSPVDERAKRSNVHSRSSSSAQDRAARWAEYAAQNQECVERCQARLAGEIQPREVATFHHSAHLAGKSAGVMMAHDWSLWEIVPISPAGA